MSSHHVVKEKQEPALLILSLDQLDPEYLGQLLEWSPTVFVSEDIYAATDALGIKIDGVLTSSGMLSLQSHTQLIFSEGNFLRDGLQFFVSRQYPALNVVDRAFLPKDYSAFVTQIDLVIFVGKQKIFPVRSGFSKWKPAGEKVHLLQSVRNLCFTNLQHVQENEFSVVNDGFYTLAFDDPFIFVAEEF